MQRYLLLWLNRWISVKLLIALISYLRLSIATLPFCFALGLLCASLLNFSAFSSLAYSPTATGSSACFWHLIASATNFVLYLVTIRFVAFFVR